MKPYKGLNQGKYHCTYGWPPFDHFWKCFLLSTFDDDAEDDDDGKKKVINVQQGEAVCIFFQRMQSAKVRLGEKEKEGGM